MSEHGSKFGDFVTGVLVGGVIGYVVALLNAPRPGDETRMMLNERASELREKAVDTVQTTMDKTGKLVAEGRDKLGTTVETTRNRVQERVSDLKGRGETVLTDVREQASDTIHRVADKIEPDPMDIDPGQQI
jgi:gas vesicle protein